jgi:hypothetical protein
MTRYRLRKEAVPFFKEDLATAVMSYDEWIDTYHVEPKALEEIKPLFVTYGFRENNGATLSGWSNPESNKLGGSHFHFTLHFPSTSFKEHDQFNKGRVVRELMDKIQNQLDYFYDKFDLNPQTP